MRTKKTFPKSKKPGGKPVGRPRQVADPARKSWFTASARAEKLVRWADQHGLTLSAALDLAVDRLLADPTPPGKHDDDDTP